MARLREQLGARADTADRPVDVLRPWLLLLPWQEVVEAPEVAELLRHQQPSERQAALELLATLAAQQPQYLAQVGIPIGSLLAPVSSLRKQRHCGLYALALSPGRAENNR